MYIYEGMRKFSWNDWYIRIWIIGESSEVDGDYNGVLGEVKSLLNLDSSIYPCGTSKQVSELIFRHSAISAVETLTIEGNGDVVYREWP